MSRWKNAKKSQPLAIRHKKARAVAEDDWTTDTSSWEDDTAKDAPAASTTPNPHFHRSRREKLLYSQFAEQGFGIFLNDNPVLANATPPTGFARSVARLPRTGNAGPPRAGRVRLLHVVILIVGCVCIFQAFLRHFALSHAAYA